MKVDTSGLFCQEMLTSPNACAQPYTLLVLVKVYREVRVFNSNHNGAYQNKDGIVNLDNTRGQLDTACVFYSTTRRISDCFRQRRRGALVFRRSIWQVAPLQSAHYKAETIEKDSRVAKPVKLARLRGSKTLRNGAWDELATDLPTTAEKCRKKLIAMLSSLRRKKATFGQHENRSYHRDLRRQHARPNYHSHLRKPSGHVFIDYRISQSSISCFILLHGIKTVDVLHLRHRQPSTCYVVHAYLDIVPSTDAGSFVHYFHIAHKHTVSATCRHITASRKALGIIARHIGGRSACLGERFDSKRPKKTGMDYTQQCCAVIVFRNQQKVYFLLTSMHRRRTTGYCRQGLAEFPTVKGKYVRSSRGVSALASHQGEPGSIPGLVTGYSQVGVVTDDAVGRRIFSGISRFPRPFIPAPLHINFNHPRRLPRPRC
ncbi:hypothetical protein PR048_013698 [Dryococelus australis]|uniref:Uncharacterized protein n=1 Tax=Dryococelus australis TaxID=614101 RepID=A0ABQ9HUG1_9NEOP|nr:hypothetical protein PR048_013698 [Dryococelus australis]